MSRFEMPERGPLQTYEVIWKSGQVETIRAHQVIWPTDAGLSGLFGGVETKTQRPVTFHGEIDGRWLLILAARPDDIVSIRLLLQPEVPS